MPSFQSIADHCGTLTNMTALSIFSASTTGILMLVTIPLNSFIIYLLTKEYKKKYNSLFYKLLLNIAIADLLTGLISDPASMSFYIKEALSLKPESFEAYIHHVSLFFTDSVALLTLTILSIERNIALALPIKHRGGIKKRMETILLFSVWPLGILSVLPYFYVGFIRQLLIFSSINISITIISLVFTTLTYRNKLAKKRTALLIQRSTTIDLEENIQKSKVQHKATWTFIVLICVFVITYLPTTVTMLYMNFCTECNCIVVHVMRDISILFILSSSVFLPLNFLLTLRHLRASAVKQIFKK